MTKYAVYGIVTADKYLGEVEADSKEEAAKAWDLESASISLCNQCSREFCDTPEIHDIQIEEVEE